MHPDELAHRQAVQELAGVRGDGFAALHSMFKYSPLEEVWPPASTEQPDPASKAEHRKERVYEKKLIPKAPAPGLPIQDIEPPKFNAGLDKGELAPAELLKDLIMRKFTPEK